MLQSDERFSDILLYGASPSAMVCSGAANGRILLQCCASQRACIRRVARRAVWLLLDGRHRILVEKKREAGTLVLLALGFLLHEFRPPGWLTPLSERSPKPCLESNPSPDAA